MRAFYFSWLVCMLVGALVGGCDSAGGAGATGGNGGTGGADTGGPFPCTADGVTDAIARGGGPHRFDCDGPTSVMPGVELVADKDVILDGEGNLTIDGETNHPLLRVQEGVRAELIGLQLQGGANGAVANHGALIMVDSTVTDSEGLIYSSGTLELTRCTLEFGWGTLYGAITNDGGVLTVINSVVSNTEALNEGGGVYNTGAATIANSELRGNFGWHRGGAVANRGTIEIKDTVIVGNSSWGDSGALHNHAGAEMNVVDTAVSRNSTGVLEGAAIFNSGQMRLSGATVSENEGRDFDDIPFEAASLHDDGGTLTLESTVVSGFCSSPVTSEGNNIESPGDTCGLDQETDQTNVSPQDL